MRGYLQVAKGGGYRLAETASATVGAKEIKEHQKIAEVAIEFVIKESQCDSSGSNGAGRGSGS
jgi:hypothetical protein